MTRIGTAAAFAAVLASPTLPADDPALYPAAQCAAFWLGRDDYARASPFLDRDPADLRLAEAFREVARRQTIGPPAAIDAFIADQRPLMFDLFDAFIYGADKQSSDLHDRLLATCAAFAATQTETRGLQ
jgi:hypothetical protein